jgi:hypothetical protein
VTDAARTGAAAAYELSGAADIENFRQNPNLQTGAWAAMAVTGAPMGSAGRLGRSRHSLARLVANKGQGGLVYSGGDIGFDRILGVAKSGKARGQFIKAEQSAGHAPYVDKETLDRAAALVHPRGERVLVGQPGLHHHDVARGAGLSDYTGWAQMEVVKGDPSMDIPARLFTTNGIGPQPNPRQIAATSRLLKKAKGVRYTPMHK